MRLHRRNSHQDSKLARSLRSSALRSQESEGGIPPSSSDSPETLTKRGKSSRVSERSIHKISSPRATTADHDEGGIVGVLLVNRRMTRAMDGEEPLSKLSTLDTPRSLRIKDLNGDRPQRKDGQGEFKNKTFTKPGPKKTLPADHSEIESTSYRKKLRYQDQNSMVNGDDKHKAMTADDQCMLKNSNHRPARLDMAKNKHQSANQNSSSDSLNKLEKAVHAPVCQDPKKLSQARAVLKSLQRQQRVPSAAGVITRRKASSILQAQPSVHIEGGITPKQSSKREELEKNTRGDDQDSPSFGNAQSAKPQLKSELLAVGKKGPGLHTGCPHKNGRIVDTSLLSNAKILTRTGKVQQEQSLYESEEGRHLSREKGKSESSVLHMSPGDLKSADTAYNGGHKSSCKVRKQGNGGSGSSFLQHWKRGRAGDRLGDGSEHGASLHPTTSPYKASEEKLDVAEPNSRDSVATPRRSKRQGTIFCSEILNEHEATPKLQSKLSNDKKHLESFLQVRSQTGDVAVPDAFSQGMGLNSGNLPGDNVAMEKGLFGPKEEENELVPSSEVFKIDPLSKCCLVATNPTETGGRQMRPRPLDLEQPLLVLVEGLDMDYYDLDGGSFYRMLQQQPESKSLSTSKVKSNSVNKKTGDATEDRAEPIVIPSFRVRIEPEDGAENLGSLYILPDSYITTTAEIKCCQAEYDMDEEDEQWLKNYNRSVSPASTISADQFEKIIDLLENKAANALGYISISEAFEEGPEPEPEECCICNGGENSKKNQVYQCSSCHILVHQSCYGIQKGGRNVKRKRNWNCRKCEAVAEGKESAELSCSLCCKEGGALKPSTEPHRWAHVVCALYTNETYFVNPDAMEPIDGLYDADARAKRQRRNCWLCGIREGSVERCSVPACKALFHVSCGVTQGASFELQHSNHQVTSVRVFCPKHALLELKAKAEEFEKQTEEVDNLESMKPVEDDSPVLQGIANDGRLPRKKQKRKSLSLDKASGQDEPSRYDKEHDRRIEDGCTSTSDPGLMEGVYLYWVAKRARQGGALLHRVQQEEAARKFDIFNSDDVSATASIPLSEGSVPKNSVLDMKVVAARQQLQRLHKLTSLVVRRERLKFDIFLLEQSILELTLAALNTPPSCGRRQCCFCKVNQLVLVCTNCNRNTCLHCLMTRNGFKCLSWADHLKSLRYVCADCEGNDGLTQEKAVCASSIMDREEDSSTGSYIIRALKIVFGSSNRLERSQSSICKGPLILLPRCHVVQKDKLASEVFWDQSELKTALISDLLKNPC